MNIVKGLFCALIVYIFFNTLKGNYKSFKKNEIKYSKDSIRIPKHLCCTADTDDEVYTYEEMEAYNKKRIEKTDYITVKWNDIISWEYGFAIHQSFNYSVWLSIVTPYESISVTDVHFVRMKRYFKKNVKEKQILNFSNKLELWGMVIAFGIIAVMGYFIFLRW